MFGRNKSSKESSRTRDCSCRTNSNVEAGSDMNRKNGKSSTKTGRKQTSKKSASRG